MILGYYLRKFYFLILFPQENKRRRKEKGSNGGRGTGPTGWHGGVAVAVCWTLYGWISTSIRDTVRVGTMMFSGTNQSPKLQKVISCEGYSGIRIRTDDPYIRNVASGGAPYILCGYMQL